MAYESETRPVRQCVVLVGGLGTRLGTLVGQVPKPMLPVAGRPFLWWLLREVSRYGITEAVLLTGHKSEVIEAACPEMISTLPHRLRVTISREPSQAGTGGALYHARNLLHDRFLLLNGDSLFDCPIGPALATTERPEVLGRVMLRQVSDATRFGVATLEGDRLIDFLERPEPGQGGMINAGSYVFDQRVLDHVVPQCSLERDVLPRLARAGHLRGTSGTGWFIDIGIPADLERAQRDVPRQLSRPALFLDRDGVCNVDHGWVGTRERFEWIPGAREAMAAATRLGWHVFIVTNQSGVARGFYSEQDVQALLGWMRDEVLAAGGTIDDTRYCPFHPEAAIATYRRDSDWRKPAPGMIVDLIQAWGLDPARCLFVGDQLTDMEAAAAAGIAGHLFDGGNLETFIRPLLNAMGTNPPFIEVEPAQP